MKSPALRIVLSVPGFFAIPLRKIEVEAEPNVGRTYFVYRDRIVAVAQRSEEVVDGEGRSEGSTTPRAAGASRHEIY